MMPCQVLVVHGGDTFDTYEEYLNFLRNFPIDLESSASKRWKSSLGEKLGSAFEVIQPAMPNKSNAKYLEWKIWLEKFLPLLASEIILVGHSLGGTFLAKYLAENNFPKKVLGTFLIAAPFDDKDSHESLTDFVLPADLSPLNAQGGRIMLYHSEDDQVVPFVDLAKYQKALPQARVRTLKDRGHFNQEEFPELVADIRSLTN